MGQNELSSVIIYGTHSRSDNCVPTFLYSGLRCKIFIGVSKIPIVIHINVMNNAWDIASVILDGYADFAFLDLRRGPVGKQ